MHANPYLRSLQLNAIDARAVRPAPPPGDASTPAPDRPALAAVADLPVGTPLDELCETVELRCPNRDRRRVHLRKLLGDLRWNPSAGAELAVVVAPDRPVLWIDGAAPPRPADTEHCDHCDVDHPARRPPAGCRPPAARARDRRRPAPAAAHSRAPGRHRGGRRRAAGGRGPVRPRPARRDHRHRPRHARRADRRARPRRLSAARARLKAGTAGGDAPRPTPSNGARP